MWTFIPLNLFDPLSFIYHCFLCFFQVIRHFDGCKADLVVCDGAPDGKPYNIVFAYLLFYLGYLHKISTNLSNFYYYSILLIIFLSQHCTFIFLFRQPSFKNPSKIATWTKETARNSNQVYFFSIRQLC